ncbi:MAG: Rieske (2Fe-2S) protein [Gemmatimonadales bacterium]
MTERQTVTDHDDRCPACDAPERRAFLRTLAGAAAGALVALGAGPREAVALSFAPIRGDRAGGDGPLTYPVPKSSGVEIDRDNEIIVARFDGKVCAFALSCPHQRSMLKWRESEGRFQCTKHKSKYSPDGTYQSGRATRNMDRHPISLEGGSLVVDRTKLLKSDDDPAAWAKAVISL